MRASHSTVSCARPARRSRSRLLKLPRWVHTLVKDADDVDAVGCLDEEQQVAPEAVATVALSDFIAASAPFRVRRDSFDRCADLGDVLLSLAGIPALFGEVPDLR